MDQLDRPGKVLIVDDNETNRELLELFSTEIGYECVLASSGIEALDMLDADIDVVLLDAIMPRMSGYEVARRIRAHPKFSFVPIVMVTALSSRSDRLDAARAGANDFILKPINKAEIRLRCTPLITMKRMQDALGRHQGMVQQDRFAPLPELSSVGR